MPGQGDGLALERASGVLWIDLEAIQANWRALRDRLRPGAVCGAVVKADAYGCGAAWVAPALARAGCRRFFVATPEEAIALRPLVPRVDVFVLGGLWPGAEEAYVAHRLTPVLNSLGEIDAWAQQARKAGKALPAALQIDSGMSRLGLAPAEVGRIADDLRRLAGISIALVMTHLACADHPDDPMNARQRTVFDAERARLPAAPTSIAASAGILLGPGFHDDVVRPGIALYGASPTGRREDRLAAVVQLHARVLQVREIDPPAVVGYGAAHSVRGRTRIATVAVGYADGYLRALSGRSVALLAGTPVPLVGRVSMDLLTFDVTAVPAEHAVHGAWIELIGPDFTVDDLARAAGTIPYEILTSLGPRYHRRYLDAPSGNGV